MLQHWTRISEAVSEFLDKSKNKACIFVEKSQSQVLKKKKKKQEIVKGLYLLYKKVEKKKYMKKSKQFYCKITCNSFFRAYFKIVNIFCDNSRSNFLRRGEKCLAHCCPCKMLKKTKKKKTKTVIMAFLQECTSRRNHFFFPY